MPLYTIETYGELQPALTQEWLVTNGLGGFAGSTVVGCNTRRYHGLLCAATLPPVGRLMLLNRLGETLSLDGKTDKLLEFSINQFGHIFHPRGDLYLRRFILHNAFVRWEYDVEGIRIVKELQMPWMKNAVGVRYSIDPGEHTAELSLLPFVRMMDFHTLRHDKVKFDETAHEQNWSVTCGSARLHMTSDAGTFVAKPDWWFGHTYAIEAERGMDDTEDLYTPGRYVLNTKKPATITIWVSTEPNPTYDWAEEIKRRQDSVAAMRSPTKTAVSFPVRLDHAAGDFVVYRKAPDKKDGTSIIAGYPWFADWGRDTMISLPGLLLATGRFEQARQVLVVFAQYVSQGMIPNRFDDYTNEPSYNTADASLWFIHAAFEYARLSGDTDTFEQSLRPACRAIITGYTQGTRFHIKVDPADGLVSQGDETTQLTWMDAKCDGICFTPRQGKAVEINALWYHALRLMGDDKQADKVGDSFRKAFWISPYRGLADVVNGTARDTRIRPNQIFAASLPNSPLNEDQQRAVVEVVRRELLTPVGLRTLDRADPGYHGRYFGPPRQRDEAYHNGCVWPWLIGGFIDAYLRVNQNSEQAREQSRRWLQPLVHTMEQACIGQISEIFEGDEPHRAVGCPAQAWSVAEVLRLAIKLG